MNRHPPQPLDAEERALAARLPRPQGRTEPGADLDARILAAAQAAVQAKPAPRRPHRSWIAPTAIAASLVLAVGLAWQLRPPASLQRPAPAAETAAADTGPEADAMTARAFEAPPPADVVPTPPMAAAPAPPERAPSARTASAAPAIETPAVAAAPPPAPPAPAAIAESAPAAAPMVAPQSAESARAAAPAMAKSLRTGDAARERAATATGNAAAQAQDEAAMAADATTLDAIADDPGEDVPPATADSPEVRDAWLRRIGELLKQGKPDEAKASLTEFRRRYPDATLPQELRKLEH